MPNWCENSLLIQGNKKELNKLLKKAKGKIEGDGAVTKTAFSLEKLYPTPKKLLKGDGWWDWRVKNWGTKWDIEATIEDGDVDDEYVKFYFDSAWSPPIGCLAKISKDYPKLTFLLKYDESGAGFAGITKVVNGEVDNKYVEY